MNTSFYNMIYLMEGDHQWQFKKWLAESEEETPYRSELGMAQGIGNPGNQAERIPTVGDYERARPYRPERGMAQRMPGQPSSDSPFFAWGEMILSMMKALSDVELRDVLGYVTKRYPRALSISARRLLRNHPLQQEMTGIPPEALPAARPSQPSRRDLFFSLTQTIRSLDGQQGEDVFNYMAEKYPHATRGYYVRRFLAARQANQGKAAPMPGQDPSFVLQKGKTKYVVDPTKPDSFPRTW